MWGDIAIAFLLAFITAFMMTPYSIKLAKKVGAVDVPKDNRRMHHKPIPKLGGVAVIAGFVVSFIYLVITLSIEDSSRLNLFGIEEYGKKILGFFVGVLILGITCFIDDVKTIKPLAKLSGQLLAAIAVVVSGIRIIEVIPFFESAVLNEAVSMILTVIWIIVITNAINLMDGLDGLSSGITMISCISLLIIFSFTLKEDRKLSKAESLLKDGLIYSEKIITYPFNYIKENIKEYKKLKDVNKNNNILETSIDRIDSIEAENIELRRQLETLKEELNINYTLSDYEYLNATVVSRNVGYWHNKITINKGTYNGVEKDMVVISSKGLIGKVIKTSTFTSDVRLITTSDTSNKISVHISNGDNNLYGLINSYDYNKNVLELEGISNTKDVNIGDYVYTSGLGGVFPTGILIGIVEEITTDSYDLAKIIKVKPSADFNDINYVSILKRKSDSK